MLLTLLIITTLAFLLIFWAPYLICMPINLLLYTRLKDSPGPINEPVSILIPARNEEKSIGALIESVQAQTHPHWELLIMDDHSTDATQQIVNNAASNDPRIKLLEAPTLPADWTGKLHTCYRLGQYASHDWMLFLDADIRLEPHALDKLVTLTNKQTPMNTTLYSGVPRQITGGLLEQLLIPLIHVVLLGYLPMWMMRRSNKPGFGAACGQLIFTRRDAYLQTQGHGHPSVRSSFHDGVKVPRLYRDHGYHTDLIDATDLCHVRMYDNPGDVWLGLRKNAIEGMASPKAIIPWSLLLGAQSLTYLLTPVTALTYLFIDHPMMFTALITCGVLSGLSLLYRLILAARFKQSLLSAILHPVALAIFLMIQWQALHRYKNGRMESWRGRQSLKTASV